METSAVLSKNGEFTAFSYDKYVIRFRTSPHLEKYIKILEWDEGYLVVKVKYDNNSEVEEEYIDLKPILENLYFDSDEFLKPIKNVRIQNA